VPQEGPQTALVDCSHPELFFGGARGGGKTDGVLGKWAIKALHYGDKFNAIMFRQTAVSAEDAIQRSKEIYGPIGGIFRERPTGWTMPGGGRIGFAYLENTMDAMQYQGRNVTDAWVEEAGNYQDPGPINRLFGVLRSAHSVPIQLVLTGNPGGPGQHWLSKKYGLVPFPARPKIMSVTLPNGKTHTAAVIPSRISDNQILMRNDPGYVDRLQMVGGAALARAWIEGDWSAIENAYFNEWDEKKHVIPPFYVPDDWIRFRSGDWGSNSPFCFGWYAVVSDDFEVAGKILPRGAVVKYREWYGVRGAKLTNEQLAAGVVKRELDDPPLSDAVLDPRCFAVEGGPSIAEQINMVLIRGTMKKEERRTFIPFRPADNKRVPMRGNTDTRGPISGWAEMRQRLVGHSAKPGVAGTPMLYFFRTCVDSIRTIPVLQHDPLRSEDLDTKSEDHAADETRYACMSRPWIRQKPVKDEFAFEDYRISGDLIPQDSVKTL
jgi:hypothetical protein